MCNSTQAACGAASHHHTPPLFHKRWPRCPALTFLPLAWCLLRLSAGGTVKRQAELFFPAEFADDFPVSLQTSGKYGLIYVVTKLGLLFVYDLETATAVYRNRISPDPIFIATASDSSGGFYAINRCAAAAGGVGQG